MIRQHLKEIEIAGMLLLCIGLVIAFIWGNRYGAWPCGAGITVLLIPFLYKAFHWKEYERENKKYIVIILVCILILLLQMMMLK
jgi:hypothetical protein